MNLISSVRFSPYTLLASLALIASLSCTALAQSASQPEDAIQTRINRARGLIAAHELETAASELESARAATQDPVLRNVTSVLLMKVYLEEGNYTRAEALLEETFQGRLKSDDSLRTYFALAGQSVNGARNHLARYRSLGVSTNDASLPKEAATDISRLRSFLERMVAQSKEVAKGRPGYDSLSLLEDVLGIRLSLATDAEDQLRWETEYSQARQVLASSVTEVASLGGGAVVTKTQAVPPAIKPVSAVVNNTAQAPVQKTETEPESENANVQKNHAESNPSALNTKATRKVTPRYPSLARQRLQYGMVRVYVVIDEAGRVVEVSRSEGPMLLRSAAEEAARQWVFEPSPGAGTAARLFGYIDFNFTL